MQAWQDFKRWLLQNIRTETLSWMFLPSLQSICALTITPGFQYNKNVCSQYFPCYWNRCHVSNQEHNKKPLARKNKFRSASDAPRDIISLSRHENGLKTDHKKDAELFSIV